MNKVLPAKVHPYPRLPVEGRGGTTVNRKRRRHDGRKEKEARWAGEGGGGTMEEPCGHRPRRCRMDKRKVVGHRKNKPFLCNEWQ